MIIKNVTKRRKNNMQLKVKKLTPESVLPKYANDGSNGLDLTVTAVVIHPEYAEFRTGIAVEIPKGYVGLLVPRSSVSEKNLVMANSCGIIDENYRGEISMRFKVLDSTSHGAFKYSKLYAQGERCGQLLVIPCPKLEVMEVESLDETVRGTGGFGSTGKK